jgi:hypothetical protein
MKNIDELTVLFQKKLIGTSTKQKRVNASLLFSIQIFMSITKVINSLAYIYCKEDKFIYIVISSKLLNIFFF